MNVNKLFKIYETNHFYSVIDASGQHTWGLFSGNRYWLGAPDQCREMERDFTQWKTKGNISLNKERPPFAVSVDSVSLTLEILKPTMRGVCFVNTFFL